MTIWAKSHLCTKHATLNLKLSVIFKEDTSAVYSQEHKAWGLVDQMQPLDQYRMHQKMKFIPDALYRNTGPLLCSRPKVKGLGLWVISARLSQTCRVMLSYRKASNTKLGVWASVRGITPQGFFTQVNDPASL
jgi:hypothetical protein